MFLILSGYFIDNIQNYFSDYCITFALTKEPENFLTPEEWEKFYRAIPTIHGFETGGRWSKAYTSFSPDDLMALFTLLYGSALKLSEARRLTPKDFDLKNRTIKIPNSGVATILPSDVEFFTSFLAKKNEGKLFPMHRATVHNYTKLIGEKADIKIFKKTRESEFEGVITSTFRESRKRQMQKLGADEEYVQLKLRLASDNQYGGYKIEDLKKWEEEHYYASSHGVVVFLDALGTKGSWKEYSPAALLRNWDELTSQTKELLSKKTDDGSGTFSFYAFSDTFIILAKKNDIEELLLETAKIVKSLFYNGITHGFYFRGCISIGQFFESQNMIIGPAVDEAAQYYEIPDWVGIFATPSAYSLLQRMSEKFKVKVKIEEDFHSYGIPSKSALGQNGWALKLDPEYALSNVRKDGKNSEITLKEFVHDQLENSMGMDIGQKWKNTLEYLIHLRKGGP